MGHPRLVRGHDGPGALLGRELQGEAAVGQPALSARPARTQQGRRPWLGDMEGLGSYGASDSEDEPDSPGAACVAAGEASAGLTAETSETETEDEETPRGAPVRTSQAASASAGGPAPAPKPAVGARIVIKPAPAIVIGDDPDAQRAHDGALQAAQVAVGGDDEPTPTLEELCARFLGSEVSAGEDNGTGALQEKVVQTLTRYHQGGPHYVEHMRTNHAFRNPEILTKLVQMLGVDPYGSYFDQGLFNPHGYKEEDFIGAIFEQQKAWLRKCDAARQARGGIDFVPSATEASVQLGATATAAANRAAAEDGQAAAADAAPARKRTKWGTAPSQSNAGPVAPAASTGNPYADFVAIRAAAVAGGSNGGAVT